MNAQAAGAVAVLIMDDKDENVKYVLPYSKPEEAYGISAPTLLISKQDSQALMKAVTKHNESGKDEATEVVVTLSFPIVKKEKADVQFKIDLNDFVSIEDILELMVTFGDVKEKLNLEPVFNFEFHQGSKTNNSPFNCLVLESKNSVCTQRPSKNYINLIYF